MSNVTTKVTGGCLCNSVRYEAEVFLSNGYLCHCTMCQRSTGQPAEITVPIKSGSLRFTSNEPKYYAASEDGQRGFCETCGSRICWKANHPDDDWWTNLCVGTLDQPNEARVSSHVFCDTKLPWYDVVDELPKFYEKDEKAVEAFLRQERNLS